jgi:hypothetical protein
MKPTACGPFAARLVGLGLALTPLVVLATAAIAVYAQVRRSLMPPRAAIPAMEGTRVQGRFMEMKTKKSAGRIIY